ncbi:hypothetical protein ACFL1R_03620 [Candidatus Latescibacterota bacterium]
MGIKKNRIKVASYTLFAMAGVLIIDLLRSLLIYLGYWSTQRPHDHLVGNPFAEIIIIIAIIGIGVIIKKYQEQE